MDTLNILFEITVYSAVIFTAIMLLKACFKNKMSPFLHYAIWFVLVLRLIMPMTIASPVRLFVIPAQSQSQAAIEQTQPQTYDPVSESDINKPVIADTQPQTAAAEAYVPSEIQVAPVAAQTTAALSVPQVLTLVWLAGAGMCIMYLALLYASLRRKLRINAAQPSARLMALFEETKAEMGIKANIKLVCRYEYGTPSLMFPRTIMMPVDALVAMNEEQTKFALRHELMHYRRGDHVMSILLSLLNAVYWFNPFVWLAFRQMRSDIETACDGAVVKLLSASARSRYASLILNLSSRPAHRQLVLGMSHTDARKAAQRRVTGIFMKGKSNMSVKLLSVLLVVTLVFTCFTTACQPVTGTPGSNPDNYTGWIPQPPPSYKMSEHWSETVQNDKVNIVIDTDVFVPDITKYPVVKVEPAVFTQQRVDELVNYFSQGKQLYLPHVMTKADYQKQLDEAKLGEKENGEYVITDWSLNEVKILEQKLKSAPEDSPVIYTDTTLTYDRDIESGKEITASGTGFLNVNFDNGEGGEASISISNFVERQSVYDYSDRYSGPTRFSYFAGRFGFALTESMYRDMNVFTLPEDEDDWPGVEELFAKVEVKPEEAIAQADEVIGGLGIKGLMLISAEKYVTPETPEKSGYMVQYARESGGIPLCWHEGVIWRSTDTLPEYSPPFDVEGLVAYVSKDGLESLLWSGCANILETVNENAEIMPFEAIKQKLKDRIIYKNSLYSGNLDEDLTVTVTSAELRMGYINTGDTRQALMVPVWVFNAYETWNQDGKVTFIGNKTTYMLSAIDGGAIE